LAKELESFSNLSNLGTILRAAKLKMVLQLSLATEADVDCIASIHLAAFDSNPLLHARCSTPRSLEGLHSFLSQDALQTIWHGENSGKIVLLARETEADDQIISFAKWDLLRRPEASFVLSSRG
jgi:hypothetical protein